MTAVAPQLMAEIAASFCLATS